MYALGSVIYVHKDNFEKVSLYRGWQVLKTFCLIPKGLNLPAVPDTCRIKSSMSQTQQNKILWCIRPSGTKSNGRFVCIHFVADTCLYPAEQSHVKPDTLTKSCRVSGPKEQSLVWIPNPREQISNTNISANSKQNSKIFKGVNLVPI
jgi:hypothetical protein